MSVPKKHIAYFDLLSVMACIAVVALHVDGAYWHFRPSPSWVLNLFFQKTFYWAVPVFYMLTGAKLLAGFRWEGLGGYLRRRFARAAVPFLVWSLVGIAFGLWVTGSVPFGESPSYYLGLVVGTSVPVADVLWFMVPLFSIYLAVPLLALVPEGRRTSVYSYLVAAYFAVDLLDQLLTFVGVSPNGSLAAPMGTGYLVFPLLGYLLSRCELGPARRRAVYLLGAGSWALMFFRTLCLSFGAGELVHLEGYLGLPSVLMASAVFLAVRTWSERHPDLLARHAGKLERGGGS